MIRDIARNSWLGRIVCVGMALAALPATSRAQFFSWNNASGGAFHTPGNWTPAGPPGAGQVANFTLNQASPYTVTFTTNPSNHQAVFSVDKATFDLYDESTSTSYTYEQTFGNNGLALRLLGTSELTVTGGKLKPMTPGIATTAGSNAKLVITGANAVLETGAAAAPWDAEVALGASGNPATGRLEVLNGASWTHLSNGDINIGFSHGNGTLLMDNATLNSTGTGRMFVGNGAGAIGTANIQNSSSVTLNSSLNIGFVQGATGTVNVMSGSTLSATSLEVSSSTFQSLGTGFLNVSGGSTVTTPGTLTIARDSATGVRYAKVVVDGAGSTLSASALEMGFNTNATGDMDITNGGVVTITSGAGAVRLGVQAAAAANMLVQGNATNTSRLDINSTNTLGIGGYGANPQSTAGTLTIGTNGVVNHFGGSVTVGSNSKLSLAGGTLTMAATKSLTNNGLLEGVGTISRNGASGTMDVRNFKTLRPGTTATGGLLTITNGNLTQTVSTGVMELLLGDPSTLSYGRIALTGGTVNISSGALDFSLLGAFTPAAHTTYMWDLITAPTITLATAIDTAGEADAKLALYGTGGGSARLDLLGTAGSGQILRLTSVPEPAAAMLIAVCGVVLSRRRLHG